MEFGLLGPLTVRHGGVAVPVTAPMQRAVLASLLTRPGAAVPLETIAADLWAGEPPRTAVATIRNYVRRLRLVLPEPVLESTAAGYRMAVDPAQVDVHRFLDLVGRARAEGDVELFDRALALWRGEPLADLGPVPLREHHGARWREAYLTAVEDAIDLRLRLGESAQLVAHLTELAGQHPLRERICLQLMTALHRSGRGADALAHYRATRERLVTGVGLQPGRPLREAYATILRGDTDPPPAPDLLPPAPAPFLGRAEEVAELLDRLAPDGGSPHCVVYGPGGAGKSALAVRVARELAGRYADGRLYVDLRGSTPGARPLTPGEVLAALLTALTGSAPEDTDPARLAAAYRGRLRGRRVLVILDNAASAEQVRAALPREPGCAALVTSRAVLDEGADVFHLDALREADAVALLARIAGGRRVEEDPATARELVRLCGRLPLALRIVATRAARHPHWPLDTWLGLLADERRRLDELRQGDVDVRASLALGLEHLGDDPAGAAAAELFPLLGAVSVPYLTVPLAAGLTGWPADRARRAMEALCRAQLLASPAPGRYVLFDLVTVLARERAGQLPAAARRAALRRAVDRYVAAVRSGSRTATGAATDHGLPQDHRTDGTGAVAFDRYEDVRRWLDRELAVLVAVLQEAAAAGVPDVAADVRDLLRSTQFYLNSALAWTERTALAVLLLELDPDSGALADVHLAVVHGQRGDLAAARRLLARAEAQPAADEYARLLGTVTRGNVHGSGGEMDRAERYFRTALDGATRGGYRAIEAQSLTSLSNVLLHTGRAADALPLLDRALAVNREIGHQVNVAIALNTRLQAYAALGEHLTVLRRSRAVRAAHEPLGDAHQRAEHLLTMARSLRAVGDEAAAAGYAAAAQRCLAAIGDREQVAPDQVFDHLVRDLP